MIREPYSFRRLTKEPSAWLPLVLSGLGLAVVATAVLFFDARHDADEGWAAHTWWILMAAQLPAVTLFAITWLKQERKPALQVLALQAGAVAANFLVVFLLGL